MRLWQLGLLQPERGVHMRTVGAGGLGCRMIGYRLLGWIGSLGVWRMLPVCLGLRWGMIGIGCSLLTLSHACVRARIIIFVKWRGPVVASLKVMIRMQTQRCNC